MRIILATFVSVFLLFLAPGYVSAVDVFDDVCSQPGSSGSVACSSKNIGNNNPLYGPDGVITRAIVIISIVVGVVAIIMIIVGGLKMITSGDNPQETAKARSTIIYALVAVLIASVAQMIVQFFLKRIN